MENITNKSSTIVLKSLKVLVVSTKPTMHQSASTLHYHEVKASKEVAKGTFGKSNHVSLPISQLSDRTALTMQSPPTFTKQISPEFA